MKKLIILRGVSGSGKSTRAVKLIKESKALSSLICSADGFFVDHNSGDYNWDPKKLGAAHAWCKARAELAMELGLKLVVIDNTSSTKWEYEPYLELAERFGYEVVEETIGQLDESSLKIYANRNRHGVSLDIIRKQAKRFEK